MTLRLECPVCEANSSIELDRRQGIPIAQNLVFHDRDASLNCATGELLMLRCKSCGFVWNAKFDSGIMRYDVTYDNDQNFSGVFRSHVDAIADYVAELAPKEDISLLEIGCGQGSFLTVVAERLRGRLKEAVGFDPAWRGEAALPPNMRVIGDYFTAKTAGMAQCDPNVIVSRHTIEHIADPIQFLSAIYSVAKIGTKIIIETPTVDWILSNGMLFDFFYEHCSIFNKYSIEIAIRRAGLNLEEVTTVFGDQYLLAVASVPERIEQRRKPETAERFDDLGYRSHRDVYLAKIRAMIVEHSVGDQGLALWGGASKGVTLALLLGEDRERIVCAIDINPRKHDAFLPGTGVPIKSPLEAFNAGVRSAIVLNPNYAGEIKRYCVEHSIDLSLLQIHENANSTVKRLGASNV